MNKDIQEEIFPLVDENGYVIGQASRRHCHDGSKVLHPVIHLHVFNSSGKLFLQKRSTIKEIEPNKWDSSVGGHIDLGETPMQAAIREAYEEIGISKLSSLIYIDKYIIETDIEKELTYCFYTIYDGKLTIDLQEVSDGKFWDITDIEPLLNKNIFTPNFEYDFIHYLISGLPYLSNHFR